MTLPLPRATTLALRAWFAFNLALVGWVGLQSLKESGEVWISPFGFPDSPQWSNYSTAWKAAGFASAALNSTLLTLVGSLLIVAPAAPAAYVLARSTRRVASPPTGHFACTR